MYLYNNQIDPCADAVFSVNGDSMEPDFHDKDLVLVERIQDGRDLQYGEIGAFITGNETYIKRYEKDGLYSLNEKYKPINFKGEESVYLIGRVLGKLDPRNIADEKDVERYHYKHTSLL